MTSCHPSALSYLSTFLNYAIYSLIGHLLMRIRYWFSIDVPEEDEIKEKGYSDLTPRPAFFFCTYMFGRLHDCFSRPVTTVAGRIISIIRRKPCLGQFEECIQTTLDYSRPERECLNMGSYNYLGFGEPPKHCEKEVIDSLYQFGIGTCSPTMEYGYTDAHRNLEKRVARFLSKDDALVFGMGFATNSTVIPSLVGKGSLIISDSLNHASIVTGARASGALIKIFKHNDMNHLEKIIRSSIIDGQPRTHRPWNKILLIVEGIYSMEGEMCPLDKIVALKKKYGFYLYMDEAHSIGASGRTGRGVAESFGVDSKDIDIFMGTFTKSFGSVGGYIAAEQHIIDHIRVHAFGSCYATGMPPAAAQMACSTLKVIMGEDGTDIGREKIASLRRNEELLMEGLVKLGFEVIGSPESPVMCVMLYNPGKMAATSRVCMKQGLGLVVVGAPATDLIEGRIRFCVSSTHSEEDIQQVLKLMDKLGDFLLIKYNLPRWKQLLRLVL